MPCLEIYKCGWMIMVKCDAFVCALYCSLFRAMESTECLFDGVKDELEKTIRYISSFTACGFVQLRIIIKKQCHLCCCTTLWVKKEILYCFPSLPYTDQFSEFSTGTFGSKFAVKPNQPGWWHKIQNLYSFVWYCLQDRVRKTGSSDCLKHGLAQLENTIIVVSYG